MKAKVILILFLLILLIVFAIQNMEVSKVRLWFWEIETPRAIMIFVCFTLGVIIGLVIPTGKKPRDKYERKEDDNF
jgi:uncharacterized integral membrane protein